MEFSFFLFHARHVRAISRRVRSTYKKPRSVPYTTRASKPMRKPQICNMNGNRIFMLQIFASLFFAASDSTCVIASCVQTPNPIEIRRTIHDPASRYFCHCETGVSAVVSDTLTLTTVAQKATTPVETG